MADEKYYEQKLVAAIQDSVVTSDNARKFMEAAQKQNSVLNQIYGRLTRLLGISATDAKTYVNVTTGRFKSGKYMTYCVDEQLKGFFAQLEPVTKELNSYTWGTCAEATAASNQKLSVMNQTVAEVRRIFGDDRARQIVARAKATIIQRTGIKF